MPLPPFAPANTIISIQTPARIDVRKWARNGMIPNAVLESQLASSLNFVAYARTKQLFHGGCGTDDIPDSGIAARTRWRFAAHTSPMLRKIKCKVLVARQNKTSGTAAPTVTLTLTNADESTTYGSGSFSIGYSDNAHDTPDNFIDGTIEILNVPADTDVYGKLVDSISARLISATVYEEPLLPTASNGYIVPSQCAATMPIYDARRKAIYELATRLWKRQGAHLISWTVDNQSSPRTVSDGTPINVVDNAASGSSGPRYRIDTRYCRTRSKATVPCVLAAYGKMSGSSDTGEVWLSGVNGGFLGTVSISGTTAKWWTTTIDLPADLDDYYIEISNPDATETLSVGAVSLFQYA